MIICKYLHEERLSKSEAKDKYYLFFFKVKWLYGHVGTEAAHCYGGFLYTLAAVCLEKNIRCTGFTVQAIKKFMTGRGNATKNEMISATRRFGFDPKSDDEADAISIMLLALKGLNIDYKKLAYNSNGSFQPLIESEYPTPAISLASETFLNFTLL